MTSAGHMRRQSGGDFLNSLPMEHGKTWAPGIDSYRIGLIVQEEDACIFRNNLNKLRFIICIPIVIVHSVVSSSLIVIIDLIGLSLCRYAQQA